MELAHPTVTIPQAILVATEHSRAGRYAQAEKIGRDVLAADPNNADAWHLLGVVAYQLGESGIAVDLIEKALRIEPSRPDFLNDLGEVHWALNRFHDAERCCRLALALKPDFVIAHNGLGNVLADLGRLEESVRSFHDALALEPDYAPAHYNLGVTLQALGRLEQAERSYRRAAALKLDYVEAHNNLGNLLKDSGRLEEAEQSYRTALALRSDFADAHCNLGVVLQMRGRSEDAEHSYDRALELAPGNAKIGLNYSLSKLLKGDYALGLRHYENRFLGGNEKTAGDFRQMLARLDGITRWNGDDIGGRSLLIWTEQGYGDSIMMLRYLPQLKQRGAGRLSVYCEPALVRMISALPGVDAVLSKEHPLPPGAADCHCPAMSLPLLFGTRLDSIPQAVPYLQVPAELSENWADKLASMDRPRVGLVWAGGGILADDQRRSIDLSQFSPLLQVAGVSFVSLQKGEARAQLQQFDEGIADWMDDCEDFIDTAALMVNLDLIISVDTAVAHLAGALGKPVWLLNRFESEWRWLLDREDSAWYPTLRIFRQVHRDDWDEVIGRVASALATWANDKK
jgi:Flp pilus assembly protein TadD